ncbi:Uncharacterised protein [Vibrio cholerae]|nr:Uncharacterised protein [Vibrio cholerae]CSD00432.1 Uncharacterised protein [Vibrio cholerae]CSD22814.1 Uncharacterised protein [Vibrio cholerae]CSD26767.1 Uncharacterised protein [Vibrio cholerae]CSI47696.1 Uncharacterised protein [Vibrio cholerae]
MLLIRIRHNQMRTLHILISKMIGKCAAHALRCCTIG